MTMGLLLVIYLFLMLPQTHSEIQFVIKMKCFEPNLGNERFQFL